MTTDVPQCPDPIERFADLFARAREAEGFDHTACTLATATPDGCPSARIVLLKEFDPRGFSFFTNQESRKAAELAANPRAALCFYYPTLGEQVRIEGRVELLSAEENDRYFATRPRQSQVGAWASQQSRPLESREELLRRCAEVEARFQDRPVERPPYWGGYRVVPSAIEFWIAGEFRLHDRFRYSRSSEGAPWHVERLNP